MVHTELREVLGSCKTLNEVRTVVENLKQKCLVSITHYTIEHVCTILIIYKGSVCVFSWNQSFCFSIILVFDLFSMLMFLLVYLFVKSIKYFSIFFQPDVEKHRLDPSEYKQNCQNNLPAPYWICQPYIRPMLVTDISGQI